MNDDKTINQYARSVIKNLKPSLRKDFRIQLNITPTNESGGVVEVEIIQPSTVIGGRYKSKAPAGKGGRVLSNGVAIRVAKKSVNEALIDIPQKMIGGDFSTVTFAGTNIYMEGNRIVFIKGNNEDWSEQNAKDDVEKAINPRMG
jgi:hypothetical protein